MKIKAEVRTTSMTGISIFRATRPGDGFVPTVSVTMSTIVAKYLTNLINEDQRKLKMLEEVQESRDCKACGEMSGCLDCGEITREMI